MPLSNKLPVSQSVLPDNLAECDHRIRLRRGICLREENRPRSTTAGKQVSLQVGQPFNPFGLFNGIFIPDALAREKGVSRGAKIVYGRLARYAGRNGKCYPGVSTLAAEIGSSERQTQRYLAELERKLLPRLLRLS